jgi:hypothetical protein
VHTVWLDPTGAEKVAAPHALLASKDENADDVKNFGDNLAVEKLVETIGTVISR